VPDSRPRDALVEIVGLIADAIAERVATHLDGQQRGADPPTPWHDTRGAARRLKKSESVVRREVAEGRLKACRVGRSLRFRSEWLDDFATQEEK
jgi:excisionase family DNA binding protein